MQLDNASILITGGAGGFGAATARRAAAAGAHVVVADISAEKGEALARELGARAQFVQTDVLSEDSVGAAVAAACARAPLRAAVIVHGGPAAGKRIIGKDGKRYELALFRRTVDYFLNGTFNALSQAAEAMAQNETLDSDQRGVLITTASIAGFEGQVGQADYSAAKGGVIGMTLTAARDLSPMGVRVMCIAPGVFLTPAYRMSEEDAQARFGSRVPNPRRMGHADEYARLAMHIIDNDYLNGEVIRIDGAIRFDLK
ncbi:MAG: SDR family NAD(P)-dependent oxidoreductase [Caulobacterales bacterium]